MCVLLATYNNCASDHQYTSTIEEENPRIEDEGNWATQIGSEENRHQIWNKLTISEYRATKESAAKYPLANLTGKATKKKMMGQAKLMNPLNEK